jgi:hypothetical protein
MLVPLGIEPSHPTRRPWLRASIVLATVAVSLWSWSNQRAEPLPSQRALRVYAAEHPGLEAPAGCRPFLRDTGGPAAAPVGIPGSLATLEALCAQVAREAAQRPTASLALQPGAGLHVGAVLHVLAYRNAVAMVLGLTLFLVVLGPWLEGERGRRALTAVQFGGAAVGAVVFVLVAEDDAVPLTGASVGHAACLGTFLVAARDKRIHYTYAVPFTVGRMVRPA